MNIRTRLMASAAIVAVQPFMSTLAVAQDYYLGTIELGESLRDVATDTATSETVISQEELDARQATTTVELLETVPNVTLVNGALPQGAAVAIRGLGAYAGYYGADGKVSIVIDGVKSEQEEIYRNGSMFALEPELFREVTVQRGPAEGFTYASGAMGGTIIMETKDARDFLEGDDTFALRQKLAFETNGSGTSTSTILAFAPDENLEVLAFAGYREMGDREDGDGTAQDATGFEAPSGLLKANYRFNDEHTLTFSLAYNEIPEEDVPYNAYDPDWTSTLVDRYTRDTTAYAAYRYNPIDNDLINLEARLTLKKEDLTISDPSDGSTSGIYNADHDTTTIGLRLENEALFDTGAIAHTLSTGVEIKHRERSAILLDGTYAGLNDYAAPGGTDESIAIYAVDEMEIGSKLTLTPQLRFESQKLTSQGNDYDYVSWTTYYAVADGTEVNSTAITGAMSARYEFTDELAVFATAAYNENLPLLDDLRSSSARENSEKGRTYELGFSYDSSDVLVGGDLLRAKVTAFQTDIWDATSLSSATTVDLYGAELEVSYVNPGFFVDVNAGTTRGTINDTDDPFNFAPADSLQLTLGKRFMDDQLTVTVEAQHAWANDRTTDTSGGYAPSEAYTVYNASAAYIPDSGPAEGIEFRASVENIADLTYRPYMSTRNAPGRTFKFSLAKTF